MMMHFSNRQLLIIQLLTILYVFSLRAQVPLDQDHDGLLDIQESAQALIQDIDQDGLDNHLDLDSDNDGIFDLIEAFDFDGDGKHDQTLEDLMLPSQTGTTDEQWETPILADDDRDGLLNLIDQDDDGDGFLTAWECPSLPCTSTFGQLHYRHVGLFDRDHLWIAVKNQVGAYTGLTVEDETKIYHLGNNQQVIQITSLLGITATSMTRNPRDGRLWILDKPVFDEVNLGIIQGWHPLHGESEILRLGEPANVIAFDDQGLLWIINDSQVYTYDPISQTFGSRMPFPLGMNLIALSFQGQGQGQQLDWFALLGGYEALPYPTLNQWYTYQRDFSQNQSITQTSPLFASMTLTAQHQIFALSERSTNNQIGQNEVNQKEFILSKLDPMFQPIEIDSWLHTGAGNTAVITAMSIWVSDQDQDGLEDLVEEIILNTQPNRIDSDGDGVSDGIEVKERKTSALNPYVCGDLDADLCDDCDREGPLGIGGNPLNDGIDTDSDGLCDLSDIDDDQDGVRDEVDAFPLDSTEQTDHDHDGIGDQQDEDDDNDTVLDTIDTNPFSPIICRDVDMDLCDDCTFNDVAHATPGPNPMQDGLDLDMDGLCDQGDTDQDGDGLSNQVETRLGSNPLNRDTDGDGLEDASEIRRDSTVGNGDDGIVNLDTDEDFIPNILDPDDDNDGINTSMELGDTNQNQIPDHLETNLVLDMMLGGNTAGAMGGNTAGAMGGNTAGAMGGDEGGNERPTTEIEGGAQAEGGAQSSPILDQGIDQSTTTSNASRRGNTYVESCQQHQNMPNLWLALVLCFLIIRMNRLRS